MIKKFNEFLEEGFMSRMVDTVYNDTPKKENAHISTESRIADAISKWILTHSLTDCTFSKAYINGTTHDGNKVNGIAINRLYTDKIDESGLYNELEKDIKSINGVEQSGWTSGRGWRYRISGRNEDVILFHRDCVGISTDIYDMLTKEVRSNII